MSDFPSGRLVMAASLALLGSAFSGNLVASGALGYLLYACYGVCFGLGLVHAERSRRG